MLTDCPITAIKITPEATDWEERSSSSGTRLAFSKDNTYGLPLMTTKIAPALPCLSPLQLHQSDARIYSEFAQQVSPCSSIDDLGSVDGRFTKLEGLETNQFDLELENGVLDIWSSVDMYA